MKYISLFAGIGGLDLGLQRAGMECVAQVEKEPFCLEVLTKHWPNVPKFKDVRNVGKYNLPAADLICGGFPCQPHSYAGKRKGAADDRNLWPEYLRIVDELRPNWVLGENVPGIVTTILDTVLSDLEHLGYTTGTFSIPACAFNAPHLRQRIWILAYSKYSRPSEQGLPGWERSEKLVSPALRTWPPRPSAIADIPRRTDGVSRRVDRLKSIGNAVVPQVAEFIGRGIMQVETCLTPHGADSLPGSVSAGLSAR